MLSRAFLISSSPHRATAQHPHSLSRHAIHETSPRLIHRCHFSALLGPRCPSARFRVTPLRAASPSHSRHHRTRAASRHSRPVFEPPPCLQRAKRASRATSLARRPRLRCRPSTRAPRSLCFPACTRLSTSCEPPDRSRRPRAGLTGCVRRTWIGFSSSVILFNKWLLDTLNFRTFKAIRGSRTVS